MTAPIGATAASTMNTIEATPSFRRSRPLEDCVVRLIRLPIGRGTRWTELAPGWRRSETERSLAPTTARCQSRRHRLLHGPSERPDQWRTSKGRQPLTPIDRPIEDALRRVHERRRSPRRGDDVSLRVPAPAGRSLALEPLHHVGGGESRVHARKQLDQRGAGQACGEERLVSAYDLRCCSGYGLMCR